MPLSEIIDAQSKWNWDIYLRSGIFSFVHVAGLLLKGMYEVWGEGCTEEELKEAVNNYPEEHKAPYLAENTTFKIVVDCFGKVLTFDEQTARIESVRYVPFKVQNISTRVPVLVKLTEIVIMCHLIFCSKFEFCDLKISQRAAGHLGLK